MNFRLFITLSKNSLKQSLAYRTSSIIMFIVSILFFVLQILSSYIFYGYTDNIAGYTFMDSINLISTGFILTSLNYCFFIVGNESIYDEVLEGEMDYKFIRPINSYWLYTFYGIDLQNLITAIMGIIFQIYLFIIQDISILKITGWAVMVILGVWYMFLISRLLVLIVFYTDKANSIQGLPELLEDASLKPKGIYPKPVEYIFVFLISYLMVFNGPIDILKGTINWTYLLAYIFSAIFLTIISYKLWFIAINKYQSSN
ncbi:ABC-2 family transporter protein [Oceanivirga salmonicida]|uniref:ABC-2 family transporter protein n=1 Tax=Oceanivirga salmonicida TaxID=1769291 RepID=UPI00083625E6|nr:ABC-2 family transporter protein [Oceanivirga salmonicida]